MQYFLHLAYQGTIYRGWQRQKSVISVQQVIEDSISKILKEKIFIHGCGRTDAGVHALQYFAHIDIQRDIDFDFIKRINLVLPHDISIYELIPVKNIRHAQFDVNFRTYTYHLHLRKIPHKSGISAYYKLQEIDLDKIKEAISIIKQTKNFRSLCKNPDLYKHTICKIQSIEFQQVDEYAYKLVIKSDRFLRGMVRYIIARLLDIGTGKLTLEEFSSTLASQSDFDYPFQKKGFPQGLYLSKVEYPYLNRDVI